MILKYDSLDKVKQYVNINNSPIVIYGAGMIGQVVMPYMITSLGLSENILFYVDTDKRKQQQVIHIGNKDIEIKSPEILDKLPQNAIILITNSNYAVIVDMLNSIHALKENVAVIIPVILALKSRNFKGSNMFDGTVQLKIPKVIHYCWFSRN